MFNHTSSAATLVPNHQMGEQHFLDVLSIVLFMVILVLCVLWQFAPHLSLPEPSGSGSDSEE